MLLSKLQIKSFTICLFSYFFWAKGKHYYNFRFIVFGHLLILDICIWFTFKFDTILVYSDCCCQPFGIVIAVWCVVRFYLSQFTERFNATLHLLRFFLLFSSGCIKRRHCRHIHKLSHISHKSKSSPEWYFIQTFVCVCACELNFLLYRRLFSV